MPDVPELDDGQAKKVTIVVERLEDIRLASLKASVSSFDISKNSRLVSEINRKLNSLNAVINKIPDIDPIASLPIWKLTKARLDGELEKLNLGLNKLESQIKENTEKSAILPQQEISIDIGVNEDGQIMIAPQSGDVDSAKIDALKPGIFQLIDEATEYFKGDGDYFSYIADVLDNYSKAINCPNHKINFGVVFVIALELENVLEEARTSEGGGNTPNLPPKHAAKITTILKAHRTLMMTSNIGMSLVADTEIYDETPAEARAARQVTNDLSLVINASEGVFEKKSKKIIVEGLKGGGVKNDIFSRRLAKNIGIATAGVVAIAAGPLVGLVSVPGGVVISVVSGIGLLFGGEAVTSAGKELSQDIPPTMKTGLERIRDFTLEQRYKIGEAAAIFDKEDWFLEYLTKIDAIQEPKMEDILQSIRKILAEDDSDSSIANSGEDADDIVKKILENFPPPSIVHPDVAQDKNISENILVVGFSKSEIVKIEKYFQTVWSGTYDKVWRGNFHQGELNDVGKEEFCDFITLVKVDKIDHFLKQKAQKRQEQFVQYPYLVFHEGGMNIYDKAATYTIAINDRANKDQLFFDSVMALVVIKNGEYNKFYISPESLS